MLSTLATRARPVWWATIPTVRALTRRSVPVLALAMVAVAGVGARRALPAALALAAVSPALVDWDLREQRLPNRLVAFGLVGVLVACASASLAGSEAGPNALALGAGVGGALLLVSWGGGIGMGDAKLGAVLAASLALIGPGVALGGLALAFLLGAVSALALIATKGMALSARIPFGPHLLAGYWIAVALWGRPG